MNTTRPPRRRTSRPRSLFRSIQTAARQRRAAQSPSSLPGTRRPLSLSAPATSLSTTSTPPTPKARTLSQSTLPTTALPALRLRRRWRRVSPCSRLSLTMPESCTTPCRSPFTDSCSQTCLAATVTSLWSLDPRAQPLTETCPSSIAGRETMIFLARHTQARSKDLATADATNHKNATQPLLHQWRSSISPYSNLAPAPSDTPATLILWCKIT